MRSNIQLNVKGMKAMGITRLSLLGALITTGVSANAVLPMVAQEELTTILHSSNIYQAFLNSVTLISLPFLIGSLALLNNRRNQQIAQYGFALLAIFNLVLYLTHLQWYPLLIRSLIGIVFGLTIPIGQFSLAASGLKEKERVIQFTMMLNLVAAGLTIVPFIGIGILSLYGGDASLLFLFLSIFSLLLSFLSWLWIPSRERITCPRINNLYMPKHNLLIAIGDASVIIFTRSAYAFVLVWLSALIENYHNLQIITLCFTLPFVVWGFIAIPIIRHMGPFASFNLFLIFPFLILCISIGAGQASWLSFALILIALLSVPEAFTPGQLISQWSSPSGRQFGNIISMALMTICLAVGPAMYQLIEGLSTTLPFTDFDYAFNKSFWLAIILLPLSFLILMRFWRFYLIPSLRKSADKL